MTSQPINRADLETLPDKNQRQDRWQMSSATCSSLSTKANDILKGQC